MSRGRPGVETVRGLVELAGAMNGVEGLGFRLWGVGKSDLRLGLGFGKLSSLEAARAKTEVDQRPRSFMTSKRN